MIESTNRIEVDENIVWFFLDSGSAIAIKHCGTFLDVIEVKGEATLIANEGVRLILRDTARETTSQDTKPEDAKPEQADSFAVFHLIPPVKITDVDSYRDGGTIAFTIHDGRGNRLQGGFSRKLNQHPRPFYIGAKLPGESTAKHLPIGGAEETALVAVLNSWIDEYLSPSEQKFMAEYGTFEMNRDREPLLLILKAIKETEARRGT